MQTRRHRTLAALAFLALPATLAAQGAPGKSLGEVKVTGNLIHLELRAGAVTPARLFDLDHRTLRFTPDGGGYRIENVALVWDSHFGPALTGGAVTLRQFTIPFAGMARDSFSVGTGSVSFGTAGGQGGFALERYAELRTVGRTFIDKTGIAAFVKPGLSGQRFARELADRVIVTWTLTEPAGGIQAFTWVPTVNRIQAVLHKDGMIELSYNDVSARDAVVGIFARAAGGAQTAPIAPDSAALDLSGVKKSDGPFAVAYEGFHWMQIPRPEDVACSVIQALGDKFDFIAMYSDFRVDNPEGGTPSTGPRGGNVQGIGSGTRGLAGFCSQGRLQWMFVQPVSTAAVQIQQRSPDGKMRDYDYAVSQIAHELGHRWAADARARVNGTTIVLGPVHWAAGVHLPAAFPYGGSQEADIMGGSTWQQNDDGTFTQLDRDYYSPAKGWSWLGLYLMGLARPEEVPPFFMLRELQRAGRSAAGQPIYTASKTVVTIEDVIAAMGPRVPDVELSQKAFNTAIVVMTEPGRQPTPELIKAANDISRKWIGFWSSTTGGRSTMTVNPR